MYTAARGKIIPRGLLFNDVGRDFDVFPVISNMCIIFLQIIK